MTRDEATQIAKLINATWQLRWSRATGDFWTQALERFDHDVARRFVDSRALVSDKPPTLADISAAQRLHNRVNGIGDYQRTTPAWDQAADETTFRRSISQARQLLGGHSEEVAS